MVEVTRSFLTPFIHRNFPNVILLLRLPFIHTNIHTVYLTHTHFLSLSHTHSLSFPFSLSLLHTRTFSFSITHKYTFTLITWKTFSHPHLASFFQRIPSDSVLHQSAHSFTLSLPFSISHTHTHTHTRTHTYTRTHHTLWDWVLCYSHPAGVIHWVTNAGAKGQQILTSQKSIFKPGKGKWRF